MTETLNQATHSIDLQNTPPRERHPLIFGRFNSLAVGQSLQLVSDHNPLPLQFQFEDRADGQFEWAALEAGPAVWRIQITRTAPPALPSTRAKGGSCCSGGACCG